MALTLPIYKRNNTFVLHLRVAGRQIKRSLGTLDPNLAKLRAMQLMGQMAYNAALVPSTGWGRGMAAAPAQQWVHVPHAQSSDPQALHMPLAPMANISCPDPATVPALMAGETVELVVPIEPQTVARQAHTLPSLFAPKKALEDADKFKMARVFGQYISVRRIGEVTKVDYTNYAKELTPYFKNRDIRRLTEADVSDLIVHLRTTMGNDARTVDNKIGFLRAVINHLKKQGQFNGANPASGKNLVSKRERRQSGTKPIAYNDLKRIFGDSRFAKLREQKPSIYLIVMTGLVTGMRVSSLARLGPDELKVSMKGTPYIDISADKTVAGNRDIPVPQKLFDALKSHLRKHGSFGLTKRDGGKGYSDAVNKPIRAFLKEHRLEDAVPKLSFHAFRKSFNNHLLSEGVEQYICGAVLGHVDETMTTGIYARTPSVETLADRIGKHQLAILEYMGFEWH